MFKTQNQYQNDPKWKDKTLGFSEQKIGSWGCLMTSITMLLNGLGYNETPETVNEKMKAAGGFQEAFFIPSVLPYVFPNVMYKGIQPCENSPAPLSLIDAALAAGKPVVLQVDWNKQAGIQTHFVLAKERVGDDYALYDPFMYKGDGPDKEVLLTKRYKYNGATLETEISGVLWFDGYIPPSPPEKKTVPLPAEKFVLYAAEDDLSLRAEPSTAGYLWKRMPLGTELICLEPKDVVKAKLGVQGKWIQIQDPSGDQGYVAGWYVSDQKGAPPSTAAAASTPVTVSTATRTTTVAAASAPAAPAKPVALPPGALLLVPTEEMSFRAQPNLAGTLIRRLPPTEQIVCLEPANQAIPKVGIQNQWLNVRDMGGQAGYVAAWYVKYASGTTAQAKAPAAPASGPVKVKAAVEGVAFRTQPVISDASLIKRVPLGTEFTLTEPGAEAKVGLTDQWLKAKDASGAAGFVAAWFVIR
jgi:hypothetical protein